MDINQISKLSENKSLALGFLNKRTNPDRKLWKEMLWCLSAGSLWNSPTNQKVSFSWPFLNLADALLKHQRNFLFFSLLLPPSIKKGILLSQSLQCSRQILLSLKGGVKSVFCKHKDEYEEITVLDLTKKLQHKWESCLDVRSF